MEISAPLVVDAFVRTNLTRLREAASVRPVDMQKLVETIKTPDGKRRHRKAMTAQTVIIPGLWPFYVTFSIETGHPSGTCRHMSMSVMREGRVPHPAGVWMVCEELGFAGGLEACAVWSEELTDGGIAINVVQPIAVQAPGTA